jgi:hypothetical protein
MALSWCMMLVVIPVVFAVLLTLEYQANGWTRFVARGDPVGEGARMLKEEEDEDTMEEDLDEEGKPKQELGGYLKKHKLSWVLPLLGVGLGLFGNLFPVAPNLLLMAFFQEFGVTQSSSSTLALAASVQFLNQGVLGFWSWCCRDVRLFVCRALFLIPPFAMAGYAVGVTEHLTLADFLITAEEGLVDDTNAPGTLSHTANKADIHLLHTYLRLAFGCFMVFMSVWVLIGVCIGGVNRYCCPSRTGGTTPGCKSFCQWIIVLLCAFNTGWLFVANIGCGAGVTTFFTLSLFLGVETKRALPTSVVIGAWSLVLPAAMEWAVLGVSFPYVRLLMVTPGLWLGAFLAPWFSRCGGPMCDLTLYFVFLLVVGTSAVGFAATTLAADADNQDGDNSGFFFGSQPMYSNAEVSKFFEDRSTRDNGDGETLR